MFIHTMEKTGVMEESIKDWRKRPIANRTWTLAQPFFQTENKECLRTTTAKALGYNAANAAHDATKKASQPAATLPSSNVPMYHCWTHGLGFSAEHTSATCTNQAEGHVATATVDNMQGGNSKIRRKRGEQAVFRPKTNKTPKDGDK